MYIYINLVKKVLIKFVDIARWYLAEMPSSNSTRNFIEEPPLFIAELGVE